MMHAVPMRRKMHTVTLLLAMVAALLPAVPVVANADPATELFISEYVEGSSFNKYLEIYNGTGGAIDLAAGNYDVQFYFNGSIFAGATIPLTGVVADGDVHVLGDDGGTIFVADQVSTANFYNGDDGVVLRKNGVIVDSFGQSGVDPGSEWAGGGQNDTLRRKASVCAGDTNFSDAFDASVEWDIFAQDATDGLGSHTATCDGGVPDPVINEFVADHVGSDTEAFVEVFGTPGTDYSAYTVLEIEGDSSGAGTIDAVLPVRDTNASGHWIDNEDMENGTITILLVEGFSGSMSSDLDVDNDGTFDSTPWTRIVDGVATSDGGSADRTYAAPDLAPGFDGDSFAAWRSFAHSRRNRQRHVGRLGRNDFFGFGFPGFSGSPSIGNAVNTPAASNVAIAVATDPLGVCNDPATLIHDIQGSGSASADVGSIREIEGIVTGDFEAGNELSGFFMQEESADLDGNGSGDFDNDPMTSEGIFVFNAGTGSVEPGDTVRVRGSVAEFFDFTEINNVVSVTVCPATGTTAPASWSLPVADVNDWEWVEGMEITIDQTLYASGNFTQARFGEVDLSIGGPLENPTNVVAPGAPAIALQDLNDRSRIQLDDASGVQNPLPLPPYLGSGNTLRTGDSVPGITGNVNYSFSSYQIEPTQTVTFARANPRPAVPAVGGRIEVAAYNVLNFFTTIDNAGPICGPLGDQGCRGAETSRSSIVNGPSRNGDQQAGRRSHRTDGDRELSGRCAGSRSGGWLNAASARDLRLYRNRAVGSDAIRQAILYKPSAVTPLGKFAILDESVNPDFDDEKNRPMVVQTFVENATGAMFTVGVNHLKSKGSNCNAEGDPDTGDGQGNCNITRTNAAQAIVDFLATDPTGSGDSDFLIIGDLNAYAMEDPVTTIEAGGYIDLIERDLGTGGFADGAYSFNFFSQSGYLDHGLASSSMAAQVSAANFWHVNTDEPSGLDYNNFNQPGLYTDAEFRSSDHDPVVIGLNLTTAQDAEGNDGA